MAKAWRTDETLYSNSNFVEDSFNISSATDANPGLYFDFTSSFANTGYAGVGTIAGFSADDVFTCKYGHCKIQVHQLAMLMRLSLILRVET